MESAEVICYDTTRVSLRGAVGLIQLPCLKEWVLTIATTLKLKGTLIRIDNGCQVQIQSFDDPECPIENVSTQKPEGNDATGLSVGVAIGVSGTVIAVIAIVVLVAVVLIMFKKSNEIQTQ